MKSCSLFTLLPNPLTLKKQTENSMEFLSIRIYVSITERRHKKRIKEKIFSVPKHVAQLGEGLRPCTYCISAFNYRYKYQALLTNVHLITRTKNCKLVLAVQSWTAKHIFKSPLYCLVTHVSMASFLWDIQAQTRRHRMRCLISVHVA